MGGWAAIILTDSEKIILKGTEKDTTHNRMEITAVIKAVDFCIERSKNSIFEIYTDSQYVTNLMERKAKLLENQFITKKGTILNNKDLLELFIKRTETYNITFFKVKAHQKSTAKENLNREVDQICRQVMREANND